MTRYMMRMVSAFMVGLCGVQYAQFGSRWFLALMIFCAWMNVIVRLDEIRGGRL